MEPRQGATLGDWTLEQPLGNEPDPLTWAARDRHGRAGVLRLGPTARAEATTLQRLDHPGVPRVLAVFTEPPAVVTTLVAGARLDLLGRTLTDELVLPIARDLCALVAHAHERGVAHGDLRPERMLVDPMGRVHVLGFGARRSLDPDEVGRMTPGFAPPEWHAAQPVDARVADAFSLGVTLHELASGVHHRRSQPLRALPLTLDGHLPELGEAISGLTHPDPAERWSATRALIALSRRSGRTVSLRLGDSSGADEVLFHEPATDLPGDRVGRYRVLRELGRGGMGMVYEAEDEALGRRVALKLLPQGTLSGSQVERRFLREARAVASLEHPHIVRVLDIGRSDRGLFFAMEFIDGGTLSEALHRQGAMAWPAALTLIAEAASAVHHAHERGVVHRDLKPGNLMLDRAGHVHVVDFGLAFPLDDHQTAMTRTGSVLGTPMYMAPEQAMGRRDQIGPRSDVYALGVVLFELLAGRPPFDGESSMQVLQAVAAGRAHDLEALTEGLPRSAILICRKAMAVDPDDRYPTAAALASDLARAARGERVRPSGPSLRRLAVRVLQSRRHVIATVGGTVLVALVTAAAFGAWRQTQAEARRQAREDEAAARLETVVAGVNARRAAGDDDGARLLLDTFVQSPQHRGTGAASSAWMMLARAAPDGDPSTASRAWVQAWAEAPTTEQQGEALVGLALLYRARDDFRSLGAALRVLTQVAPDRLAEPAVAAIAAEMRLATGAATPEDRADPIVAALSAARPAGADGTDALTWVTPTGAELWALGAEPASARRLGPDGARPLPLPPASTYLTVPGSLLAVDPSGTTRWRLDGDAWTPAGAWPGARVESAALVDLDRDGEPELYGALRQTLRRLDPDGLPIVEPDTSGAGSELTHLRAIDLDGDGADELALAANEWGAYDVRVITGPTPRLIARHKLGTIEGLAPRRVGGRVALVALKADVWPSRDAFPEGWLAGNAPGLYLLGYETAALRIDATIPPPRGEALEGLWTADLDGDGDDEIVTNTALGVRVLRPLAAGWASRVLPGLRAIGAADADGDGDDELLVRTAERPRSPAPLWWLGAGDGRPPLSDTITPEPIQLPSLRDPGVADLWAGARKLATVGLPGPAAQLAETIAAFTAAPEDRIDALRAAGALYERSGEPEQAAASWAAAAQDSRADADHRAAAAMWARAHQTHRELAELRQITERTPNDLRRLAELRGLGSEQPDVELVLGRPLGPPWRALTPVGARNDPLAGALAIDALPGPVLAAPVAYAGGPLLIAIDVEHGASEWGGALRVGLSPTPEGDGAIWGIDIAGRGGGGIITQRAMMDLGRPHAEAAIDVPGGVVTSHQVTWLPGDQVAVYEGYARDELIGRRSTPTWGPDDQPGPMPEAWLVIAVAGDVPAAVHTRVRGIMAWGLTEREGPPDVHPAWLADMAGRPDPATSPDPIDRAGALLALGDARQAIALVLDHPEHPLRERVLDHLLHVDADRALPLLAPALGPTLPARFAAAWQDVVVTERYDPGVRAVALHPLLDLAAASLPSDPDARRWLAGLARVRAIAAIERGELSTAERALPVWLALDVDGVELSPARAHQVAARLAIARGDTAGAMAEVHAALAAPEGRSVVADRLKLDPMLLPLQAEPGWEEVARAAAAR